MRDSIYLTSELKADIKALAKQERRSLIDMVRAMVALWRAMDAVERAERLSRTA